LKTVDMEMFPLSPQQVQARAQQQARYLITNEILYNPEGFLVLRNTLPALGDGYILARAALGDRSVITDLLPLISTWPPEPGVNKVLSRIESPELYSALTPMMASEASVVRNRTVTTIAAFQGRERIEMLANMAMDSKNYFGTYNGMTIGESAISAMRMDRYPDESVLALVRVARSENPEARKAARMQAASFAELMDRVEEANVKAVRSLPGSPYEDTRAVVVHLLSRRSNPSDLEWLRARLDDSSFLVKKQAARALGKLRKREAFDLLDHPSWFVRSGVADGLAAAAIADPTLIGELDTFEKNRGGKVRRPIWTIKARARGRPELAQPVVKVKFKELDSP
jgi:hypothetical protein